MKFLGMACVLGCLALVTLVSLTTTHHERVYKDWLRSRDDRRR